MMAITLDVRQPEQIDQCEILLHSQPGLGGEILTGHEVALAAGLGVPHSAAGGVEDGFVEPLAAFARHSGVAERAGKWEGAELGIGLVDDHRLDARQCGHVPVERMLAIDRLLDEEDALDQSF